MAQPQPADVDLKGLWPILKNCFSQISEASSHCLDQPACLGPLLVCIVTLGWPKPKSGEKHTVPYGDTCPQELGTTLEIATVPCV